MSVHEFTIQNLLQDYPEASTRGFKRSVHALQKRNGAWPECLWPGGLRPDIFWIDDRANCVFVLEVEDSNKISSAKLDEFGRLRETLFNDEMELALIASDRWGNLTPVSMCYRGDDGWGPYGQAVFALTTIGCIKDKGARAQARRRWLAANPDMDREVIVQERRLDRRREKRGLKAIGSMA